MIPIRPIILAALLALAPACLRAEITFDSSFESGNATAFRLVAENTFQFQIEPDTNSSDRQWFYFQVNGAKGETLTFRLPNTDRTNVRSHWNGARPIASTDGGETWQRVGGETSHADNVYTFSHTFTSDTERIALHYPYTFSMALRKIEEWSEHSDAESSIIGYSVRRRPIWFFQITDREVVPPDGKLGIWVVARQHSAEVTGSFSMEAFMDFLLSDEPDALALRHNTIINVAPFANPDGAFAGNYRNNYAGINLNRVWDGSATLEDSPEIVAIAGAIDQWVADGNSYVLFADLHSTASNSPHFAFHSSSAHEPPLYLDPPNYHAHSRAFLALVNKHAPHFNPTHGPTSNNSERLAYHRQRNKYGVLAFTFEGTFNRQHFGPNPDDWQSPVQHRQAGVALAKAIAEYYELTPLEQTAAATLLP